MDGRHPRSGRDPDRLLSVLVRRSARDPLRDGDDGDLLQKPVAHAVRLHAAHLGERYVHQAPLVGIERAQHALLSVRLGPFGGAPGDLDDLVFPRLAESAAIDLDLFPPAPPVDDPVEQVLQSDQPLPLAAEQELAVVAAQVDQDRRLGVVRLGSDRETESSEDALGQAFDFGGIGRGDFIPVGFACGTVRIVRHARILAGPGLRARASMTELGIHAGLAPPVAFRLIRYCCPIPRRLFTNQYSTSPEGKLRKIQVNMIGMTYIMRLCAGSGIDEDDITCCTSWVAPMMIGVTKYGSFC